MGILDKIKSFFSKEKKSEQTTEGKEESQREQSYVEEQAKEGKICAYCSEAGADKKFAGKYWHKKCLRQLRKAAKGFLRQ